jgi:hypothetical protein
VRLSPLRIAALALIAVFAGTASGAHAGDAVHILVLKEHGIGSSAQAQPHVDRFVELAAERNGWASAKGKYVTRRARAEKYISSSNPHYGILSLGAFLAMRSPHNMSVVGLAEVATAGGRRYHLVSKNAGDLGGCKGKTLATNHAEDAKFIDKVVAGGSFTLGDFDVVKTRRPVQTIKAVVRDKAVCALIDDAQMAAVANVSGAEGVKSVWKSELLPPMPVVAFPSAPASEKAAFRGKLGTLCKGKGRRACKRVGLSKIEETTESTYAGVIAAYGG